MKPPRWVLAVAGFAVLALAADVGVFLLARGGGSADAANARDHIAVIDPKTQTVVRQVEVGHSPTAVVTGYGGVWVLNKGDSTLTHIDARTRKVVRTIHPDATANDITTGAGGLWFAGRPRGRVQRPLEIAELERIDPATGAVNRRFDTHTGAAVVAEGGGALWSTGYLGNHVRGEARSDARTGAMSQIDIGIYGDLLTADDNAVYWVASAGDRIARVSTKTGVMTASLPLATDASLAAGLVPPNPTDVAVGGGSVWISTTGGTVIRLDPNLRGISASIPACRNALALDYGEGAVWVACGDGSVVRVDPSTDQPGVPITVGGLPRGIAAGEGAVWVTLN